MAPSMLPVLPYIFDYLAPSLPQTFYVPSRDDYLEIRASYRALTTCALVCTSWRWTAQVALFRCAIIARPDSFEFQRSLTVYGGGMTNSKTFFRTLRERPALGLVVRSLHLFCNKWFAETVRDILSSCSNVSVLVFTSYEADHLSASFSCFGQYPSVRVLGHKGGAKDKDILPCIGRCFPGIVELQVASVHLEDPNTLSTGAFCDLQYLHVYEASADISKLATLDIRVLRIHRLYDFQNAIIPFKRTLRKLDIWKIIKPNFYPEPDAMDGIEDFLELRVLKVFHDQHPMFPRTLPPNLETLVINFYVLDSYPERVRRALEPHTSVRTVTILYHHSNALSAFARTEKVLGGLSLDYRLVAPGDNVPAAEPSLLFQGYT